MAPPYPLAVSCESSLTPSNSSGEPRLRCPTRSRLTLNSNYRRRAWRYSHMSSGCPSADTLARLSVARPANESASDQRGFAPSLSIIIPVLNGEGWIGRCISHIRAAIDAAAISQVEVLVIDDGSTDETVREASAALPESSGIVLKVFSQSNSGRFAARRLGLSHAIHEFVLFIDTRVFIDQDALAFVLPLLADPKQTVWTSHVEAATDGNPLAGFWQA